MSDSETMTILLLFHHSRYRDLKALYLNGVKGAYRSFFPKSVSYNRFVELEARVFYQMMFFLRMVALGGCTGVTFVDSTMAPVCHNLRRRANKVFAGFARDGKGTMGWYRGFKLHFTCNDRGEVINFCLTGANVDDRADVVWSVLAKDLYVRLFANRGYISARLAGSLFSQGVHIVTGPGSNMRNRLMPMYDKIMLRKRYIIECVNDTLKNTANLVHSRHRSLHNFIMNITSALGAYCFYDNKPQALVGLVRDESRQLYLF